MKFTLKTMCLMLVALCTFSCYDDSEILTRLDALESDRVASIETQISQIEASLQALQAVDVALDEYIEAVSDQNDSRIDELKSNLEEQIKALTEYLARLETQQKNDRDWVTLTFSTLEQYDATCAALAVIEAHLKTTDTELVSLSEQITNAVSSIKTWVNEQLSAYYTIAQTDAIIDAIVKENTSLRGEIVHMHDSLQIMKQGLTADYQSAIKQAIEEHDGKITKEIAAQVESLNTRIDQEVAAINARIDVIEQRVAALEEAHNSLPRIIFEGYNSTYAPGEMLTIPYTIVNADENTMVETVASGNWKASVRMEDYNKGVIMVKTSTEVEQGKVLVFVNKGGHTVMSVLLFDNRTVIVQDAFVIDSEGGTLEVALSTNYSNYQVSISPDAQSWLTQVSDPSLRSTMYEEKIYLEVACNAFDRSREALVHIVSNEDAAVLATFTVYQFPKEMDYATSIERGQVDTEAAGIVEGGSALTAGTVLAQSESVTMTVGADDTYKTNSAVAHGMTFAIIGGATLDLAKGTQGSTNPKDASGGNCDANVTPPASGAFFAFDVKKDGYLYVFHKASTNKTYLVSEEGALIGYEFAAHTPGQAWGDILAYTLQGEGEYNYITDASLLTWSEKIALGEAWEATAGAAGKIGASGTAVIKFPVYAGCKYTVNACGSKMMCAGFIFSPDEQDVVITDNSTSVLLMKSPQID